MTVGGALLGGTGGACLALGDAMLVIWHGGPKEP